MLETLNIDTFLEDGAEICIILFAYNSSLVVILSNKKCGKILK